MSKSLRYLRDLTERLLSCESPRPRIDLKRVSAGLKCSKSIIKKNKVKNSKEITSDTSDDINNHNKDQLSG